MESGLRGARVLVTGGSGGIGAACVRLFAAEGADVVVHYNTGRERALAAGGSAVVQADLTDETAVDRMFAETGALDVCAAVAGVWPEESVPVWELSLERWRATVDANLTASFLTARGFFRNLGDREGSLVLVGSTAGLFGEPGHADYAAAKSGILGGLLLTLKNDVIRRNPRARVNAVAPGWTASPMTAATLDEAKIAEVTRTMALAKIATPEDVAAQVVALSSPTHLRPRNRPGSNRRRRHGRPSHPRLICPLKTDGGQWPPSLPIRRRNDCRQFPGQGVLEYVAEPAPPHRAFPTHQSSTRGTYLIHPRFGGSPHHLTAEMRCFV